MAQTIPFDFPDDESAADLLKRHLSDLASVVWFQLNSDHTDPPSFFEEEFTTFKLNNYNIMQAISRAMPETVHKALELENGVIVIDEVSKPDAAYPINSLIHDETRSLDMERRSVKRPVL